MDEGICSRPWGPQPSHTAGRCHCVYEECRARRSFLVGTGSGASTVDGVIPTPAFPGDETGAGSQGV